jgi:tRNA(Ile2) C34 agmatinyltransferase TiaS
MEIHKKILAEGNQVLQRLEGQGVGFEITDKNTLRITTKTTLEQFELIRLWKKHIIDSISPHCPNCALPMQIIGDGELWFCPFGCETKERDTLPCIG